MNFNQLIDYAKTVPYFPANSCAWGHAALGFGAGFMDPWVQAIVAAGFIAYEVWRDKPTNEKIGAVAEFATGWTAQKVLVSGK